MMSMPKSSISAQRVFEQAECFYQTFMALLRLRPDPREDVHATVTLAEPLIVLAAFANELFLKCIICIETGDTTHGHNLKELFDRISETSRARMEKRWDDAVVERRREEWDRLEGLGLKVARDLPSALAKGAKAFERYRYSYEENADGLHFYLEDLSGLLERLILEMRPDFEAFRRAPLPLQGASYH
jgi:hypothetical protein